jgi:hypothetical protein
MNDLGDVSCDVISGVMLRALGNRLTGSDRRKINWAEELQSMGHTARPSLKAVEFSERQPTRRIA